jgi:hypothetical protein
MSNTDMSNTDMSNTDMSNTDMSNTDMSNTDMSNTDMSKFIELYDKLDDNLIYYEYLKNPDALVTLSKLMASVSAALLSISLIDDWICDKISTPGILFYIVWPWGIVPLIGYPAICHILEKRNCLNTIRLTTNQLVKMVDEYAIVFESRFAKEICDSYDVEKTTHE